MQLSDYYDWKWGDKPYGQIQTPRPGTPPTLEATTMTGIYNFYLTNDERTVGLSPNLYDRMLLEGGRVVWLRTERYSRPLASPTATPTEEAALGNEPRPGEQYLGTVEL